MPEKETTAVGGSLLQELLEHIGPSPEEEKKQYSDGIRRILEHVVSQRAEGAGGDEPRVQKVDRKALETMISQIDKKVSKQLDKVMHHPDFQKVESAWRGLEYVVRNTRFDQNIVVEMLNVTKDELREDFEDTAEGDRLKSALYQTVYGPYDHFGDLPYAAVIGNYAFDYSAPDVNLLRHCAAVSTMAHAPFIASAGPQFFRGVDYRDMDEVRDWETHFKDPKFVHWQSFRTSEDSRNAALVLPRFLLRTPYGGDIKAKSFDYQEEAIDQHDNYLWGNAAFAFAARMTDSFAKTGWYQNTVGPEAGGAVEEMKLHQYEDHGQLVTKVPTEHPLSDTQEKALSDRGFIPLVYKTGSDMAAFFSANSVQSPKFYGQSTEGKDAELNYRLGTKLPYLMLVSRFAHYLKVMQRLNIGKWKSAGKLRDELTTWIKQYASNNEALSDKTRAQRPLSDATVDVQDVPGQAGTYLVKLRIKPYFKFEGADFELSLVGKLDAKGSS
jgi:type VI secretion system protein ImpC